MKTSSTEFVFDLDDTLYSERDYTKSALTFVGTITDRLFLAKNTSSRLQSLIEHGASDPIGTFWSEAGLPKAATAGIIAAMQAHVPDIALRPDAKLVLDRLRETGHGFSIVTDGRSVTQRAKLAALDCLDAKFISISEEVGLPKSDDLRFQMIESVLPNSSYCYIADNPAKDFVAPNRLKWNTILLKDDGQNLHSQNTISDHAYLAQRSVSSLTEIIGQIE